MIYEYELQNEKIWIVRIASNDKIFESTYKIFESYSSQVNSMFSYAISNK